MHADAGAGGRSSHQRASARPNCSMTRSSTHCARRRPAIISGGNTFTVKGRSAARCRHERLNDRRHPCISQSRLDCGAGFVCGRCLEETLKRAGKVSLIARDTPSIAGAGVSPKLSFVCDTLLKASLPIASAWLRKSCRQLATRSRRLPIVARTSASSAYFCSISSSWQCHGNRVAQEKPIG